MDPEEDRAAARGHKGREVTLGIAEKVTGPGAHVSEGHGGGPWGSRRRPDWSTQTKVTVVLVSTTGSYLRGMQGEGPGETGELADHRVTGEVRSGTHILLMTLQAALWAWACICLFKAPAGYLAKQHEGWRQQCHREV